MTDMPVASTVHVFATHEEGPGGIQRDEISLFFTFHSSGDDSGRQHAHQRGARHRTINVLYFCDECRIRHGNYYSSFKSLNDFYNRKMKEEYMCARQRTPLFHEANRASMPGSNARSKTNAAATPAARKVELRRNTTLYSVCTKLIAAESEKQRYPNRQ